MDEETFVNVKESIAAIIFDFEGEDYIRPHEEHCHEIAERILNRILHLEYEEGR